MKTNIFRTVSLLLAALLLLPMLGACTPGDDAREDPNNLWLVKDGASMYSITSDSSAAYVAALTFGERLYALTGVIPTVCAMGEGSRGNTVSFSAASLDEVGNYGYSIGVEGRSIHIRAASLAGFDQAIDRFFADASLESGLSVPVGYAAGESLYWDTDYTLPGENFNPAYLNDVFYNDKNDGVAYVTNAMWHQFGAVDDGQNLVYPFGNEPTWYEWMSEKLAWSGNTAYIDGLKERIRSFPQTATGYMWSWGSYPYWKVDECYSIHYDGTFRYISAVYDLISWEGSTAFLQEVDGTAFEGEFAACDSSSGRTVLEKTEACLNYILEYLYGKEGYILLTEESTYLTPDGSVRFDYVPETGKYCWNNTGRENSTASNYWDNLCFGNYDAYENALFYQALGSMIGIYRMLGGDYVQRAEELEQLRVTVKEKYNELYWSEDTGRYIACIDADGNRVDYGLTFLNLEAIKYGLADRRQAGLILDWIDGRRVVESDTRKGSDIMSYAEIMRRVGFDVYDEILTLDLRLAPTSNTVAINNNDNKVTGKVWWHGPSGIDPFGSAAYGKHLENGGYIFYTVFYELMSRVRYQDAQAVTDRLMQICRVYEYNRLQSDATAKGSAPWLEGLVIEFPESGLVPTAYLYGMLGAEATHNSLRLAPVFNNAYELMGVKKLTYGGKSYGIRVDRDGSCSITCLDGAVDMTLAYTPCRFGTRDFTVTVTDGAGNAKSYTVTPADGVISLTLQEADAVSITVKPCI